MLWLFPQPVKLGLSAKHEVQKAGTILDLSLSVQYPFLGLPEGLIGCFEAFCNIPYKKISANPRPPPSWYTQFYSWHPLGQPHFCSGMCYCSAQSPPSLLLQMYSQIFANRPINSQVRLLLGVNSARFNSITRSTQFCQVPLNVNSSLLSEHFKKNRRATTYN